MGLFAKAGSLRDPSNRPGGEPQPSSAEPQEHKPKRGRGLLGRTRRIGGSASGAAGDSGTTAPEAQSALEHQRTPAITLEEPSTEEQTAPAPTRPMGVPER